MSIQEIAALAVFIIILLCLAPALIGDESTRWYKFVYNFQTLITGIFAIGAAYLTVVQLRQIEKADADRHNQLMRLQSKTYIDTLDRALIPQANEFHRSTEELAGLMSELDGLETDELVDQFLNIWPGLQSAIKRMREVLKRDQFIRGTDVFDGLLYRLYQRNIVWMDNLLDKPSDMIDRVRRDRDLIADNQDNWERILQETERYVRVTRNGTKLARELTSELRKLQFEVLETR